jgi:FAD/FMN-containing dehydrogenase
MAFVAKITSSVGRELGFGLRGQVICPGDHGYDAARAVFNGMINRRPLAVVRPADASDVVRCIEFTRRHNLPLSVRGAATASQGTRCATAPSCLTCPE